MEGKQIGKRLSKTTIKVVNEDQYMAAAIGDVEWLKQSLGGYPKRVNFDRNGFASLHLASLHGRLECIKILVEKCSHNVNLPSSTGWRPIHLCINNQTGKRALNCVKYLMQKGADCSIPNDDGVTPVHQAASEGHVQCLKALIEEGAVLNAKDQRGHTPLELAKLWGHRQCARILTTETWHKEKKHAAWTILKAQKERSGSSSAGSRPNSIPARHPQQRDMSRSPTQTPEKRRPQKHATQSVVEPPLTSLPEITPGQELSPLDQDQQKQHATLTEILQNKFENEDGWNVSLHLDPKQYVCNNEDCYPRDVFTCMPMKDAAPEHLAKQRVIPVSALTHPDSNTREVVFKCKNVIDVQKKRMTFDANEVLLAKPQAPFHLSSDVKNWRNHDALWVPQASESASSQQLSSHPPLTTYGL